MQAIQKMQTFAQMRGAAGPPQLTLKAKENKYMLSKDLKVIMDWAALM